AAAVGVALLCAAGLAGWLAWHGRRTGEAVPLLRRVLVQPPQVPAGAPDPRLALAASGVLDATLASLAGLQGIAVLDPRQLASQGTADAAPAALARSVAADEVLSASVRPAGNLARVTLRRLAGGESRLLWTSTFQVAANPDDLRLLSEAVGVHVQRGFPEHPPRPGLPVLEVRDEDYAAYLALKQSLDAGHTPAGPELAAVEAIVRGSPRFLAGLLLAGELARSLFLSTQEARYLDRAQDLARRAEALAPGDPRPPVLSFRLAVLGGRAGEPEAALARLEAALPGDPQVFSYRAELAEARGRAGEALRHMQAAAQRIPSWRNLYDLAGLELRSGRMPEARRHLRTLLERSPGNLWGTEALAQLELRHGDPHQAGLLFAELATREPPQRSLWTNLGLARFLAGDPEGAAAAYRKALEIEPGHSVVLLNLADAELARGRRQSAEALYRQTLSRLAALEARSTLQAADRMAKAQCLAHLGRAVEAAEIAQRTLQQSPDAPDAVYAAALVYALVGDRTSALLNAKAALRLGMSPSWFRISAFDSLRGDPELQGLLRAGALSG
ncbi:MAG TPA: hypothetical protein DD490_22930, partial [Acidobacteria bacterium]|nr:hypothetical protein [Acidobacteriota bacterium]